MKNEVEFRGINGSVVVTTEHEYGTHIAIYTTPGYMCTVLENNAETRRFLRTALKRMNRKKDQKESRKS